MNRPETPKTIEEILDSLETPRAMMDRLNKEGSPTLDSQIEREIDIKPKK